MAAKAQKRNEALAKELPKIELHLHLDGSLSPDFIANQASKMGVELPVPPERIRAHLLCLKERQVAENADNAVGSGKNWSVFDFCNQFLQTEDAIAEAVSDLCSRLRNHHNVRYAEIRFCPALHTTEGLSEERVVEAAIRGFEDQNHVAGGLILCALRSYCREHGLETAALAARYIGGGVVLAMDVAGFEGGFPLKCADDSMDAGVRAARRAGVPVTVHAGECPDWKFGTVENVRHAIDELGATRIGHGLALGRHLDLARRYSHLRKATVEVCLTSNVARGYKVPCFAEHPARAFHDCGLPFSLSCDNLLLSGDDPEAPPSPAGEVLHLVYDVFDDDELKGWNAVWKSLKAGVEARFARAGLGKEEEEDKWGSEFMGEVAAVFKKHGMVFGE